jgi:CBS domain containing-hemolysin-like protein
MALSGSTSLVLRGLGVKGSSKDEIALSGAEIRALLKESAVQGEISPSQQRLIDAIFEIDDLVCRQIMVWRSS